MTHKIAIIFEGDVRDNKGLFNSVYHRVKELMQYPEFEVGLYCIQKYDSALIRLLRRSKKRELINEVEVSGLKFNILWYKETIRQHFSEEVLHLTPLSLSFLLGKWARLFSDYTYISAHSFLAGRLAYVVNVVYGTSFSITWHGSDIHTHPSRNKYILKKTAKLINSANVNFFVSKGLLQIAQETFGSSFKGEVSYNGVSKDFKVLDKENRDTLRLKNSLYPHTKVVAYIGNFYPVKNAGVLPELFNSIRHKYDGDLVFWVIGGGKHSTPVLNKLVKNRHIDFVFLENQEPEKMPGLMNCIDVLVVPSRKEGFSLVSAEAIACGANVVGTDVCGVNEVLTKEFLVPFDENLVENMAEKVAYYLKNPKQQTLPKDFSWKQAADKEYKAILRLSKTR